MNKLTSIVDSMLAEKNELGRKAFDAMMDASTPNETESHIQHFKVKLLILSDVMDGAKILKEQLLNYLIAIVMIFRSN